MKTRAARFALVAVGLLACLVLTLAAFGLPVLGSLNYMLQGAFGDKFGIARTLVKSIPLLVTGLGIVIAWRAGMYNIGGEGQFLVGGLAGAAFYEYAGRHLPPILATPGILVCCVLGGAAYGYLAGWLYTRRGVEVVISTILLNFLALQVLSWAVSGPLQQPTHEMPLTDNLPDRYMLPKFDPQTDLHWGIFLAILAVGAVTFFLSWTRAGFNLQVVGASSRVARANRIDSKRVQEQAMLLSGALCGLAGGIEYLGTAGMLGESFSQQWGFLAIPVALLGGLHPVLVILSALYFGALFAGSEQLARFTPAGSTLIYVIQAVAVMALVSAQAISRRNLIREDAA